MGVLEERQVLDQGWRAKVDERLEEHQDLLQEHARALELGSKRFSDGESRMRALDDKLSENNSMTSEIRSSVSTLKQDTDQIVKWVKNITGFKNVLEWGVGMLVRLSVVIVAAGIVWWFVKDGQLPRKVTMAVPGIILWRRSTGLQQCGAARASLPTPVLAEDFSTLVRWPRVRACFTTGKTATPKTLN